MAKTMDMQVGRWPLPLLLHLPGSVVMTNRWSDPCFLSQKGCFCRMSMTLSIPGLCQYILRSTHPMIIRCINEYRLRL